MELSVPAFLLLVGVPILLGSSALLAVGIRPSSDRLAYPGWVWTCGALGVAALEVARLVVGVASPLFVAGSAVAISVACLVRARKAPVVVDGALERGRPTWSRTERVFLDLVVVLVLAAGLHQAMAASLTVVQANDEATFWAQRAKLLHAAGGFGDGYARAVREATLPNGSYPILNPLLQLWVFDCAGGVTHVANRFPIQLCTLALLLCTAGACRRASRPGIAAALLLLLAAAGPTALALRQANADVMVALGGIVAADAWQRGANARAPAWAALGSAGVAFAFWSKREGVLLVASALVALAVVAAWRGRRPITRAWAIVRTRAALWAVPPAVVCTGTLVHNRWLGAEGSHGLGQETVRAAWAGLGNVPRVVAAFVEIGVERLLAIPVAFAGLALLLWPRRSGALAFVPVACLGFVAVLVVAIARNADYLLTNAAGRVLFQLLPLQLLWLAAVGADLLAELRRERPTRTDRAQAIPRA